MRVIPFLFASTLFTLPVHASSNDIWYPLETEEGKYFSRDISKVEGWPRTLSFRYLSDGQVVGGYEGQLVQDIQLDCRTGIVTVLKQTMTLPNGSEDAEWAGAKPYSYHAPYFAQYGFGELCRGEIIAKAKQ